MSSAHTTADAPPGARQLARGITATWWYTVSGVVMIEAFLVIAWTMVAVRVSSALPMILLIGIGGGVWLTSTLMLLFAYRHRGDADSAPSRVRLAVLLGVAIAYGASAGAMAGSWLLALAPVAQSLVLLNWAGGIRYRLLTFVTIVLVGLGVADAFQSSSIADGQWWAIVYTILVPIMTVSSLWWWDVLVVLDRARTSEARLAATQERLRVATDVHDLQGHHLQVIALQLELAERLHAGDPDAALEQLRAARASVAEARQGTRDLATRFRTVPLSDELANARDLLSAAGLAVEAHIVPEANLAPADDLGPVIRETTTNVLRHGGGRRARLSLMRMPGAWRYEIANDAAHAAEAGAGAGGGSGLDGIRRRIAEAQGTLDVHRGEEFVVAVTVPDRRGSEG